MFFVVRTCSRGPEFYWEEVSFGWFGQGGRADRNQSRTGDKGGNRERGRVVQGMRKSGIRSLPWLHETAECISKGPT